MSVWFIDKLNMHQDHKESQLPIVGSEMVLRVDISTGQPVSQAPNSIKHEGSYSSSLMIRCNGTRVSVTGNPSRWHRSENLFGFTSIDDCVRVYNQILAQHGLPPFTKCTKWWFLDAKEEGSKHSIFSDGAIIDHIDFTRNFSVGAGAEVPFLRGLSGQAWGKGKKSTPYLYPNCMTVDCHKGSTLRYSKVYVKSHDLITHKNKRLKDASDQEIKYYERVIDWCQSNGVLREEHSFKGKWLRRKRFCFYGMTSKQDFAPYLKDVENAIERLEVMNTDYETISDQLLEKGIVKSRQSANSTQAVAFKWLYGMPIPKNAQYYVHRPRLLSLGIDISLPHDVTRMPLRIRSNELIDIKVLDAPSWYKHPSVKPNLALVS